MKVVLDSNVLVSGIFFGGMPEKILEAWMQRKFEIFVTPSIFEEYGNTLEALAGGKAEALTTYWIASIAEHAHHVVDPPHPLKICRDPDDDKFLYCAASIKADFLVTGDKDLKELEVSFDFKIVSPRTFLSILERNSNR